MIQLRYFASLREALGIDSEQIDSNLGGTVGEVRAALCHRGGRWKQALGEEQRLLAAVNHELATPETAVSDGDELAFFPPVTGG